MTSGVTQTVKSALRGAFYAAEDVVNRRVFGNCIPARVNVKGYVVDRTFSALAFGIPRSSSVRAGYEADGFSRPGRSFWSDAQLDAFVAAVNEVIESPEHNSISYADDAWLQRFGQQPTEEPVILSKSIRDLTRSLPSIYDLINDDLVSAVCERFGTGFYIKGMNIWRSYHLPERLLGAVSPLIDRWHFDSGSTTRMRFLLPLGDVTAENGATQLFRRADTRRLMQAGYKVTGYNQTSSPENSELERRLVDAGPWVQHVAKRGEPLMFNPAWCLHRQGPRDWGKTRDMLMFDFRKAPRVRVPSVRDPAPTAY